MTTATLPAKPPKIPVRIGAMVVDPEDPFQALLSQILEPGSRLVSLLKGKP